MVSKALEQHSSDELSKMFDSILTKLNNLKKNECFEGIPKFELPPKGIQKLAFQLSNSQKYGGENPPFFFLTNIHFSSYYHYMWNVDSSEEYDAWFKTLDEKSQIAVLSRVLLLRQYGPQLPRPYADSLKGSKKYKNLKELRNQTEQHVLRVSYYFDSERNGFLLTGGDKKGKDQDKFYKDLIAESEVIIERHERRCENERRNQNDGK